MKNHTIIRAKLLALLILTSMTFVSLAQSNRPIGINLDYMTDYNAELPFVNTMHQCREWISFNADGSGGWDSGVNVPLMTNGYPTQIPYNDGVNPPQAVRTLLFADIQDFIPHGNYRLVVEGQGQVRLWGGANGTFVTPCNELVAVNGTVFIEIEASNVSNPINDIKFILPNYVNNYQDHVFNEAFLDYMSNFECLRFMNWSHTNYSPVVNWADRGQQNYYTQSTNNGVAWEYIVMLSNLLEKDLWINVPHMATNDYMNSLASFLSANVNPQLKIYIEYSNEVWNGIFPQHQYAAAQAQALGYPGQEWERSWKYTAKRSADLFQIFEDNFSDMSRVVKVLPGFAAVPYVSEQILTHFNDPVYNPTGVSADAFTIAPYFAQGVADEIVAQNEVSSITVEQIVQRMSESLPEVLPWINEHMALATQFNLDLICYEGGQHLVANGAGANLNELTVKLNAANHHPALQDVYCDYFDLWYNNAGGLFLHYKAVGPYGPYGSWGLMEHLGDTLNPKYLAMQNCVLNQNTGQIDTHQKVDFLVYPNPSSETLFIRFNTTSQEHRITIMDVNGKVLKSYSAQDEIFEINVSDLQAGLYLVTVSNKQTINTQSFIKH